jgi:hypothetical protein
MPSGLHPNVGQDGILRADWQSALVPATELLRQDQLCLYHFIVADTA